MLNFSFSIRTTNHILTKSSPNMYLGLKYVHVLVVVKITFEIHSNSGQKTDSFNLIKHRFKFFNMNGINDLYTISVENRLINSTTVEKKIVNR